MLLETSFTRVKASFMIFLVKVSLTSSLKIIISDHNMLRVKATDVCLYRGVANLHTLVIYHGILTL